MQVVIVIIVQKKKKCTEHCAVSNGDNFYYAFAIDYKSPIVRAIDDTIRFDREKKELEKGKSKAELAKQVKGDGNPNGMSKAEEEIFGRAVDLRGIGMYQHEQTIGAFLSTDPLVEACMEGCLNRGICKYEAPCPTKCEDLPNPPIVIPPEPEDKSIISQATEEPEKAEEEKIEEIKEEEAEKIEEVQKEEQIQQPSAAPFQELHAVLPPMIPAMNTPPVLVFNHP